MAYHQSTIQERRQETWRAVVGYEGCYSVSNLGRVKRDYTGRILKPGKTPDGYLMHCLCQFGVQRTFTLHLLVAKAFIGPCPNGQEVNHIDLDKTNCRASNLEYLSHQKNMQHAARNGVMGNAKGERHGTHTKPESVRRGENHLSAKLTLEQVGDIRRRAKTESRWGFNTRTAKEFNVTDVLISLIVRNKIWKEAIEDNYRNVS